MHRVYPHGVGFRAAYDRTSSGDPVTNFARKPRVYRANNGGPGEHDLNRDNDHMACEAHRPITCSVDLTAAYARLDAAADDRRRPRGRRLAARVVVARPALI
jgi:hypothetical protein